MSVQLFKGREQRHFDRKQLYYYLKVLQTDTGRITGYLGDISSQGLMVFSKEKIEPETVMKLTIDLGKELDMAENLVFEAKSLWCEKDANPDYYAIGFMFIDFDQNSIDTVMYLTKKYGFAGH